jgi:hypothetical protein
VKVRGRFQAEGAAGAVLEMGLGLFYSRIRKVTVARLWWAENRVEEKLEETHMSIDCRCRQLEVQKILLDGLGFYTEG